jgi:catechol 2,3-dioxygenase-like lactoylglutathione lyase family enzyme
MKRAKERMKMLMATRLGTRDFEPAKAFYDQIAALLGAKKIIERPGLVGYKGEKGEAFLLGTPLAGEATSGNGTMVSFVAPDRATVAAVHAKALELGGTCEGEPGPRGLDGTGFYAAYFRDLDGNKILVGGLGIS